MASSYWKGSATNVGRIIFDNQVTDTQWWDAYGKARPQYSQVYWKTLYSYHDERIREDSDDGHYDLVHDVGCGPGNISRNLAQRFTRVVASDVSFSGLNAASIFLSPEVLQKISLVHIPAEEWVSVASDTLQISLIEGSAPLPSHLDGAADLVLYSECIPLMDSELAVASAARLLNSGGTIAISFYGRLTFGDNERGRRCQELHDQLINTIMHVGNPPKGGDEFFKRAAQTMASKLDNVALPEDTWEDVERHKWNSHKPSIFMDKEGLNFEPFSLSKVGPRDRSVDHDPKKESPQYALWDISQIRAGILSAFPAFKEAIDTGAGNIGKYFKQLEAAIGGPQRKMDVEFPSVMVLARRK